MRLSFAALSAFAIGVFADSSTTTLGLFINGDASNQYVGSVVRVKDGTTTLALACTSGDNPTYCATGTTATVTENASVYIVSSSIKVNGAHISVSESCSVAGTTMASCVASVSFSTGDTSSSTQTTTTLSGSDFHIYQVPITAGVDSLTSTSSSSSGSSNAAAVPTQAVRYAAYVVPVAVALGAMA